MLRAKSKIGAKPSNYKQFLDFDSNKKILFNNLYIEELKLVIKLPLFKERKYRGNIPEITVEKFNLAKYTFLTSF